jgi:hypothetical protein
MRLYLIGKEGKIVYTGERGPFGFNPDTWSFPLLIGGRP